MMNSLHLAQPSVRRVLHLSPFRVVCILSIFLVCPACAQLGDKPVRHIDSASTVAQPELNQKFALRDAPQVLPGDRMIVGTVKAIQGDQIKVDYGDSLQPRYLPLSIAKEKGMELEPGDRVRMLFNEQHLLVDFHPLGSVKDRHTIIVGTVAQEIKPIQEQGGPEAVVIKSEDGQTHRYPVRQVIRSKVASVPTNVPAVFLLDETNHIVDVTFGDFAALENIKAGYRQMTRR